MTWSLTKREGGSLFLRIDDGDVQRTREDYVQDIFDSLQWLEFSWDQVIYQSQHTKEYRQWLQHLPHYACDCSRKQLEERGVDHGYDGHCRERNLSFQAGVSQLRLRSARPLTDMVLWRKEDLPAYQLASVVDDLRLGVNFIVRGEDLRESSEIQQEMARLSGIVGKRFADIRFIHHELLLGTNGKKLAKSKDDLSLKHMRLSGMTPQEVFSKLAQQCGLTKQATRLEDFLNVDWKNWVR